MDERALIEYLFERQNYNPLIRPVQNLNQTLDVGFEMALIQIINLVSPALVHPAALPGSDKPSALPAVAR